MNALHELQKEFISYLKDDTKLDIIDRVESTRQRSASKRVALYGDAYQLRLKEALNTDYERLHAYLGDQLFYDVMNQYIQIYPSHYTSLRDYGQHMPVMLGDMSIFSDNPEVVELANIELAFANSFDAMDCKHVTLEELISLAPDAWPELTFQFSASVQLLALQNNSFKIWRALSHEETPPDAEPDQATWLLWRSRLVTHYRALDGAELTAIQIALRSGKFSKICEALLDYFDEQKTPLQAVSYVKQWLSDQMLCCVSA